LFLMDSYAIDTWQTFICFLFSFLLILAKYSMSNFHPLNKTIKLLEVIGRGRLKARYGVVQNNWRIGSIGGGKVLLVSEV